MEQPALDVSEEPAVRAVEEAYDRAWCAGDLDSLMGCLASDAIVVSPRGDAASGEAEIRSLLGAFLNGEARGSDPRSDLERISFIGNQVAVVDGHASIVTAATDAETHPEFDHSFTDILVKNTHGWRIAQVRAYDRKRG